jgi:hypothetical protein
MTEEEKQLAMQALARMRQAQVPAINKEDLDLLKKYPRHTLEQAREIDAASPEPGFGYTSGFELLVAQEEGRLRIDGDHT